VNSLDKIKLTHMVIYAHHGAFEEERKIGQRFEIDVELGLDLEPAASTDKLDRCIDYEKVYKKIVTAATEQKFHLIESVARHIAHTLLNEFIIQAVTIRIRKPHVPINGSLDHVEVEITRHKS
jgi:7,8-dihydroneopterin aldolase/epimerase/oxygenase